MVDRQISFELKLSFHEPMRLPSPSDTHNISCKQPCRGSLDIGESIFGKYLRGSQFLVILLAAGLRTVLKNEVFSKQLARCLSFSPQFFLDF